MHSISSNQLKDIFDRLNSLESDKENMTRLHTKYNDKISHLERSIDNMNTLVGNQSITSLV